MAPSELGRTVLSLVDEAHASQALHWLSVQAPLSYLYAFREGEDRKRRYINIGVHLGSEYEEDVTYLIEQFRNPEGAKHLDTRLDKAYSGICEVLDATYQYLLLKRTKLSERQSRAVATIRELRDGCVLCGGLNSTHTSSCSRVKTSSDSSTL